MVPGPHQMQQLPLPPEHEFVQLGGEALVVKLCSTASTVRLGDVGFNVGAGLDTLQHVGREGLYW